MTGPRGRLATPADWPEVAELRHRVFVQEQGVPAELERDAADATAVHALSRDDAGRVVATGRLLPDAAGPGRAVIGRMAADSRVRGRGHGAAVLAVLHEAALARGQTAVELHAQVTARRFYERAGYAAVGAEYLEAGITHVTMARELVAEDGARETVRGSGVDVTDRSASSGTRPVRPPE
ncbi:MAG: putative acetyltransferase [Modestobacter sp.]|nr:putative acetyltransferase [Modestobacter sp.]